MSRKIVEAIMSQDFDVSFFIPVYRPPLEWLDQAVRSIVRVIRQSECKAELLLGDDGSPDGCFSVLSGYEKEFPGQVRAFHFSENRGVGAVSTDLCKLSYGRYIASFDQDDIMLPFDLDRVVRFLDENPKYGASYAQKFLFGEKGLTGDVHGDNVSPFIQFFQPKLNINAMLIRRETLFAHELFKPLPYCRINHDVWLMLRLAEDTFYHYDRDCPRALYRVHSKQSSTSHGDSQQDWFLIGQDIVCRHHDLYRELLFGTEFPKGATPQEEQLIQGLCGLAVFLNQRNMPLMRRMVDYAITAHPEDYGVREIRLQLLQHDLKALDREYRRAVEDFADDPDALYVFASTVVSIFSGLKKSAPAKVLETYRELSAKRSVPPPIVSENVPAAKRASLSWNIPTLKV